MIWAIVALVGIIAFVIICMHAIDTLESAIIYGREDDGGAAANDEEEAPEELPPAWRANHRNEVWCDKHLGFVDRDDAAALKIGFQGIDLEAHICTDCSQEESIEQAQHPKAL